ncbi:MAG: ECF-type sigma factor [Pseudomonadota bacterium]
MSAAKPPVAVAERALPDTLYSVLAAAERPSHRSARQPAPPMTRNNQLTHLLNQWRTGDEALLEQIVPAVYDELHRVAKSYMRNQPAHHTLQATALINEAFLKLGNVKQELENRSHFIGIVARLMRQILVDHARAKTSLKRGGGKANASIDDVVIGVEAASVDVLALESVLKSLEKTDSRKVRIAELLYFCGATYKETGEALGISQTTLHREHTLLKALLARALGDR